MQCEMPHPNDDVSPYHGVSTSVSPSFVIPPHVMGRTVHNPTIDTAGPGRRPQKPRPGMRVPYRNLTSQIVTQDEIAEEILKRQMKRNSTNQPTVLLVDSVRNKALHFGTSADTTFAKSLSQKLANQLSCQADVEEKSSNGIVGNNVLWPQVEVESSDQGQFINSHGYPVKENLSVEVIHGDSNGIDVAITPRKKPSISPRINSLKTSKLDREAEKEMALKQLKELPMIKDSESAVRRKNLLKSDTNIQLSLSMTTQSDLKNCVKSETKIHSSNEEKLGVNSSDNSSDIGRTILSSKDCVKVQLKNSEANCIHPPVSCDGKLSGTQSNVIKSSKNVINKMKWNKKTDVKSSIVNGQCKKVKRELGLKRRSVRLSDKDVLDLMKRKSPQEASVLPGGELKRKRGRPSLKQNDNQSTDGGTISPVINVESSNSACVESSHKKAHVNDDNANDKNVLDLIKRKSPQKAPVPSGSEMKRKRGRPSLKQNDNQSTGSGTISPVTNVESSNSTCVESSPKKARVNDGNANDKNVLYLMKRECHQESSVSPGGELKRKRGRPSLKQNNNQSTGSGTISPVINVESSNSRDVCETTTSQCSVVASAAIKFESNCALKSPMDHNVIQSQVETKEPKMSDGSESPKQSKPTKRKPAKRYASEIEKLVKDEGAATMLLEACAFEGVERKLLIPMLYKHQLLPKKNEIDKLINDEGVVNMLLGTGECGQQIIVKKKLLRTPVKELRRTSRQGILYKANLARKSLMRGSSHSRLRASTLFKKRVEIGRKMNLAEKKRQLFAKKRDSNLSQWEKKSGDHLRKLKEENKVTGTDDKLETPPVAIDITKSPSKRERDSSLSLDVSIQSLSLPLAAKASRIIRRHSSSSSFSSRSSSPVGINIKGRRGSSGSSSPKEIARVSSDAKDHGQLTMTLEPISEVNLKSNTESNRFSCVSKRPNSRKATVMPRMSAAVRLKLNTEMSKNFQKGLNIENAKNICAKISSSPKAKKSPTHSEQSFKFTSVTDMKLQSPVQTTKGIQTQLLNNVSDVKLSPSVEIIKDPQPYNSSSSSPLVPLNAVTSNIFSPTPVKDLEIVNSGELAVCVKKLQERKDVSITAINESGERTMDAHTILATRPLLPKVSPEVYCAPSVIPRPSAPSADALVEVVPKLKKLKNPKASFLKNILGKEHRIVGLPLSPIASYHSVVKNLENITQKHKKKANIKIGKLLDAKESFRQRSSGRQNAGTYNYKEICLRRYENFVQLILTPSSTKMKNSLNVQVLHEFRDALQQLGRDEFCKVVLVTSTGSSFCQGVDLHSLLHTNIERRKRAAQELSEALKEFLRVLAMFHKPIVAGVHGATVGLGVTMLPFFDVVYASDKATFHAPYARLGQIPEGAAVLTLPLMIGNAVTSELLFGSRKLTASEALHYGLVSRVFWPDTFQEELIPNIRVMANQSSQSMQAMKALLRLNLRVKLEATLDSESSLLVQHWCSPECQRNFRKFLETSDEVLLQRQKKDPC